MAVEPTARGSERLELMRQSGDLEAQRRHAWELLARLVQAPSAHAEPAFESWYGEGAVFARDAAGADARQGIRGFARPPANREQLGSAHGAMTQSSDAAVLSYTLYNRAAYQHIRSNRLHLASQLERLRTSGAPDDSLPQNRAIPSFPADAIVLKTVWWPVARDGVTALPVWDADRNPVRPQGNPYTTWQRIVAVDARANARLARTAPLEFAGRSFEASRVISVDAFHHVVLDASLAQRLNADRDVRKVALIALGRPLETGDSLILVGASLASKEIADWVWATFWWHDRADESPYASQRPASLTGVWRSLLMQVAFDAGKPLDAAGAPHVCFNPWLEARFPDGGHGGGTVSNCVSCHRRASYPAIDFLPVTRGAPDLTGDPAYVPARLRTGLLWSLAMHALPE